MSNAEQTGSDPSFGAFNPFLSPQRENPHPVYERARREAPVYFSEVLHAWVITRHEDIQQVLKEPNRFSSAEAFKGGPPWPPEVMQILADGLPNVPTLVDNDPPDHTRFRSLVNKAFTPRRIAEREGYIRELANGLMDKFANEGRADLVKQYAHPLPSLVIADVLGVPREDVPKFDKWSYDWIGLLAAQAPLPELMRHARGTVEFQRYLADILGKRERDPKDDMLTDLVQGAKKLDPPAQTTDLVGLVMQALFAGHETTAGLIAATIAHLLRNSEQLEAVRKDRSLVLAAVEEAARMETPVWAMYRTAMEDVEIGGVRIPKGDRLQVLYASANRDECKFANPHRFDVNRPAVADHMAYGRGVHYCIGAALARLEGRIAVETFLDRLPNARLEPDQAFSIVPSATIRRLERLNVIWDAK